MNPRLGCTSTTCFRSSNKLQSFSDRQPYKIPDFFRFSCDPFRKTSDAKRVFSVTKRRHCHFSATVATGLNSFQYERKIFSGHVHGSILLLLLMSTVVDTLVFVVFAPSSMEVIMNWKKELGRQILQARERLGLSQDQLAAATKLSRQTINLCENGRRGPSVPAFVRLASALRTQLHVSGHNVRVERGRRERAPEQFCLPFGITRIYSGAVLKVHPTKARLTIEASVKRIVF